jgi:hypothetical protein
MKTAMTVIAVAGALAVAVVSNNPNDAQAHCRGCGLGLGIVGGLVASTIIGGAIARSAYPAYAVVPGYEPYVGYAAPVPVACPGGYWARQPLLDQWGRVVSYSPSRAI